jgi:hypothetical protein
VETGGQSAIGSFPSGNDINRKLSRGVNISASLLGQNTQQKIGVSRFFAIHIFLS